MNRPKHFWIAWGLFALVLAITLAHWASTLLAGTPISPSLLQARVLELVPLLSTALAALIVARHPRHSIGWLLMAQGIGTTLAGPVGDYVEGLAVPPANPSVLFLGLLWFNSWAWLLLIFPLLFIPLYFPTGRLLSPRWRVVVAFGLAPCLFLLTIATFTPSLGNQDQTWTVPNPIGLSSQAWQVVFGVYQVVFSGYWNLALAALAVLSLASLFLRYRRGSPVERQQIKWLLSGCAVFAAVFVPSLWVGSLPSDSPLNIFVNLLFIPALLAIPASIAIAILRHRLWDIDVIIRRTLLYTVLTVLLALVYFGSVVALQGVFTALTGAARSELVTVLSTLAIAALFVPLRQRVQAFIDRRFYRRKYDAARTLAKFGASLRGETDLATLTEHMLEVVNETMEPAGVTLWLK